jgi:hypothetical protein
MRIYLEKGIYKNIKMGKDNDKVNVNGMMDHFTKDNGS